MRIEKQKIEELTNYRDFYTEQQKQYIRDMNKR